MGLLNPAFAETVTRQRPVYDNRGNIVDWDLLTVSAVVEIDPAARKPGTSEGKEDRFFQDADLYVPRGSDIAPGDHIPYHGQTYIVAGRPRGDQVNAFTGDDFGWMVFRMQGAG
ncbi:hypothetical protein [Mycobacterium malmoense]|uniref:hypothetical protein n=1 Tax=Mycobacterium malmoense TaxID=1780 RepID=UPI0008F8D6B0|nr:hypothetical protein [Mycobacterium malmoense]OIN80872.1 hypothetical protein BMG05_11095 [Mycobacterium malmoense]